MCGIAGVLDLSGSPIALAELISMGAAIAHRGPDDEGYVAISRSSGTWNRVSGTRNAEFAANKADLGLAHRRLSIIDLSSNGHQPFVDPGGTCCIVINGEIYNYVELRAQLSAEAGIRFVTQTDTEVLVEAYKHWGEHCFSKLNGFWALALYDFRTRRLLLSRDRIGKKPLFWTRQGSKVYFASEIKALLQVPEVYRARKVNRRVAATWLVYGKKDLDQDTFFDGIQAVPPASFVYVDGDLHGKEQRYWSLPGERLSEKSLAPHEAAIHLRDLLESAVALRLRSDVPVAVELSGGLDSSTLAAFSAKISSQPVSAYTVRFPQKEWNEEPFAAMVASALKLDYHVIDAPTADIWVDILLFTYLEEEPYHSPNLYTNQAVWAQMRAEGFKVSVNGAGGDEVLAGYGQYYGACQRELLLQGRVREYMSNAIHHTESSGRVQPFISPLPRLLGITRSRPKYPALAPLATKLHQPSLLSKLLVSDMTRTLMPYWMTSGDRGFMGVPLEVRAPFLDYRVLEFAFQLPIQYLIRDGWHKWILRKAMHGMVPEEILWRRRKLGFPFPIEHFYSSHADILEVIYANVDNPFVAIPRSASARCDWKLISFLLWYELFFNENYRLFEKISAMAFAGGVRNGSPANPAFLSSFPGARALGAVQ